MEARLKGYIDHIGRAVEEQFQAHYDAPLAELNQKINSIIALLQTQDVTILNILQNSQGNEQEQVGETSAQVYVPTRADDDWLTYITLDMEVYSQEKIQVQKRVPTLCTPYIANNKPKRRKQVIEYDPSRPLDGARVQGLWSWINSIENPKKTHRGGTTNMDWKFFKDLLEVGLWISNEVRVS